MRSPIILAALALTTLPVFAALPPHYQRQNELMAILTAAVDAFGISRPIEGIVLKSPDLYEVTSGNCSMEMRIVDVAVEGQAPGFVGPRNFSVVAGPLNCTD